MVYGGYVERDPELTLSIIRYLKGYMLIEYLHNRHDKYQRMIQLNHVTGDVNVR